MKSFLSLALLFALFITGCNTAKYQYDQGNNFLALTEAVNQIRKTKRAKKRDTYIKVAEKAFNEEKTRILRSINQKKASGNPSEWVSIFALYENLGNLQDVVAPILPLHLSEENRQARIELVDIAEAKEDARVNAATYQYEKAERLLQENTTSSAREAYRLWTELDETIYPGFRDTRTRINQALEAGLNRVLIRYTYPQDIIIPISFIQRIQSLELNEFANSWVAFYYDLPEEGARIDYAINIQIEGVDIGPEQVSNNTDIERATVIDGERYVYDANGNVAKDSLGNDITEPNEVEVRARVTYTTQQKMGILHGRVSILSANNQSTITSTPIQHQLSFRNQYATYRGDERALSTESRQAIRRSAVPFPTDNQMILDGAEGFRQSIERVIANEYDALNRPLR